MNEKCPLPLPALWAISMMPGASTAKVRAMAKCEVCGNDYDKSFEVIKGGESHTFDSFECAIHMLAPRCAHCNCRIIGHGTEAGGKNYCCANCARHSGHEEARDRVA
jgi:hypothetical protein